MKKITVTFPSGRKEMISYGTPVIKILEDSSEFNNLQYPVIAALVNNELTSLSFKIEINAEIKPVTLQSSWGVKIYRRSLCFLLAMANAQIFPERRLVIGHSLGSGFYYYFDRLMHVEQGDLDKLKTKMYEIVKRKLPVKRKIVSYSDAINLFETKNQACRVLLLKFRNESKIPIYVCNDFIDLAYQPLVPNTSILKYFDIISYPPGFILKYPHLQTPTKIDPFEDNSVLFSIYREYKAWGKILNIDCAGKLNSLIDSKEHSQFIRVAEALHDKKIAEIADKIFEKKNSVKIILIAGPSSSGKTTFTKKLEIQLRVLGLTPVVISLDNYFLPREFTPRDENGEYDFESIDSIDVKLLNEHLLKLFRCEEIEIPVYNFKTGKRKPEGEKLLPENKSILLMEGIHGLNDKLTPLVASEHKYKIYVSALTQLNLDDHNRIPTTDNRLLRRIVRDNEFRGHSALTTLSMWASVRRGEEKNIFPFQNNADSAFNSALDYELSVLKTLSEPLLKTVKPFHKEYAEARRLLSFLNNFIPIPVEYVPGQSILREFIGNSDFKY